MDYLTISDSRLAIIGSGREVIIYDRRVEEGNYLGKINILLKQGHGFHSDIYRQAMRDVYDVIDKKLNVPGGFDVVGQDSAVIDRALTGRIQIHPNDDILLMSDGFTRAIDTLDIYPSWSDLLHALKTEGGEQVIRTIRESEVQDSNGRNYPRSSAHDDATLLWLRPGI
jgi:hypothetical protein